MKKIFTKLMLLAVAAAALVSCENNYEESTPVVDNLQTVTLSAEKPTEVRTQLIEGVPYWSKDDQIGVYVVDGESYNNYAFKNDSEEASLITSFTGETAVANTLYVYYPYTNFSNPVTEKGVKVEILANQEPTAASFDGRSDLMIAKPVQLDAEGKQLSDLEFARVAAIVKIVLNDKTGNLAGQHISALTMTAANNLTGRVYLDVVNQELGELYYGGSKSVTATYTEATQYEVNGTNATYVVVYPQTLAAGSTLSFEAATEGYAISKSIELGQDIVLESGKVTTLNVSLAAENVIKEEAGLALPFKDDFARVAYDANENAISLSVLGENYSAMDKVYKAKVGDGGILKLGTSSAEGYFTTVALDLSKPFTVFVEAQRYGTSTTDKLQITVGSQVLTSTNLTADSKYYVFEFEAASKKEQVEIRSNKRAYINDLQIVEGHGLDVPTLPAVLTVSTAEISGVSHEGEAKTFTYSVANPVDGVSATVTDNVDWITTADNNGTVTVTVAANEVEEAREGVVTVTYGDLTKTVTVSQAAKPAEGGETGGTVVDVLNYAFTGISGSSYTNWSGKTGASGAVYAGNSYANNSISYIQLRTTSSNSGIVTTTSGGKVRSITIAWASNTGDGKTLDVYGKSSAYSAATDLYGNNKGTKIGTLTKGQSNTLTITGNYEYIGMRSTSGAIYITQLEITWETGEGGGSTPEPATPVLSVNPTTLSFDAAAGSKTVTCTIENEVSGQNVTATSSNTSWLTTSVSGKTVTVTATANTGAARNATVTIAYAGAESKTVTVTQAAAENTGGNEGGSSEPVTKTINLTGGSGSTAASWSFTSSPVTCTVVTNGNSNAPRLDSNLLRMYAANGKSNLMTITTDSSPKKKITKVIVYCTTSAYADALNSGAATVDSGASVSKSKSDNNIVYTITGNTESIKITTGGQARMNKIDVTYQD